MKNLVQLLALAGLCLATTVGAQMPPPQPPTIAVSGHGEVTALPDLARLSLAADALDGEVKRAEAERPAYALLPRLCSSFLISSGSTYR